MQNSVFNILNLLVFVAVVVFATLCSLINTVVWSVECYAHLNDCDSM